ncbi:MAG: type II toxin-antitoxin system Phd/YefM family antitoxin [Actinobacteria bacterium]|nr:type II toxin-antitoxin system Phd/YefM family antitoxin [Actinomycetota bacterium]
MITVGIRELKNRTSEYIRRVRSEGPLIITSNGRPLAAMIPLEPEEVEDFLIAHSPRVKEAIRKGLRDIEKGRTFAVDELIEETEEELGR